MCVIKMDKKRLKIALAVLHAVRNRFPEAQEFITSTLKRECEKERMTIDEVIFFILNLQKNSLNKHCFRFDTMVIIFLFVDVEKYGR